MTFVLRTAISVYWCYTNYFIRIVSGRVFDENNTLCSSFETFLFFTIYLEQSTPPPNSSLNPSCGSSLKQNVSRVAADLAVNDRLLHLPLTGNRCVGLYVGERTNAPPDNNLPLDICPLWQTSASLGICTVFGKIRLSGGTYVRGICSRFLYTAYVATELLLISISVTACSNYRFVWARDLLGSCGSHGIPMGIGTEMLMGIGMEWEREWMWRKWDSWDFHNYIAVIQTVSCGYNLHFFSLSLSLRIARTSLFRYSFL